MGAPGLDVDKEQVRMLVLEVGVREAARKMNLKEGTVCQWSKRGGWLDHLKPENQPKLPVSMQPKIVSNVIKPVDALVNSLLDDSKATRASLSRAVRRTAEHAANLDPETLMAEAANIKATAQTASLVHQWEGGDTAGRQLVIDINLIGARLPDLDGDVIDV